MEGRARPSCPSRYFWSWQWSHVICVEKNSVSSAIPTFLQWGDLYLVHLKVGSSRWQVWTSDHILWTHMGNSYLISEFLYALFWGSTDFLRVSAQGSELVSCTYITAFLINGAESQRGLQPYAVILGMIISQFVFRPLYLDPCFLGTAGAKELYWGLITKEMTLKLKKKRILKVKYEGDCWL